MVFDDPFQVGKGLGDCQRRVALAAAEVDADASWWEGGPVEVVDEVGVAEAWEGAGDGGLDGRTAGRGDGGALHEHGGQKATARFGRGWWW